MNHSFCPASHVVTFAFSSFFLSSPSKNIFVAVPLSSLLNFEVLSSLIFATKDAFAIEPVFSAKDISSSDPFSSRSGVVILI